jgi:hypothetical protein
MSFAIEKASPFDIVGSSASRQAGSATAANSAVFSIPQIIRRVLIEVYYDAAATPGNLVEIVPKLSCATSAPLATDDVWTIPGIWDGVVTDGAGTTPPAGSDYTASPNFGRITHDSLAIRTPPTSGASDKIRIHFSLNVEAHKHMCLQYADLGGNPGTIWIRGSYYA